MSEQVAGGLVPGEEVHGEGGGDSVPPLATCRRERPEARLAGAEAEEPRDVIRRVIIDELSGRGVTWQRADQVAARIAEELGKPVSVPPPGAVD